MNKVGLILIWTLTFDFEKGSSHMGGHDSAFGKATDQKVLGSILSTEVLLITDG
jgi:hypothetical protein